LLSLDGVVLVASIYLLLFVLFCTAFVLFFHLLLFVLFCTAAVAWHSKKKLDFLRLLLYCASGHS
jgi:hypothetical protein